MINKIAILAKPASGKTDAILRIISPQIELFGYKVVSISDRPILNDLVENDALKGSLNGDGWYVGTYSWIKYDPSGNKKLRAMSGHLWNLTHQNMIKRMREEPVANTVELYEFGIGPKVSFSDEDLLQEASDIFSWMYDEQVSQHIAVVEIDTPFHIRSTNNDDRDPHERMDKKTFDDYFLDGGEGNYSLAQAYGIAHYHNFQNNRRDPLWFDSQMNDIVTSFIHPLLEGHDPDLMRRR